MIVESSPTEPVSRHPRLKTLLSIQHLRGVAATMVVIHHSSENYPSSIVAGLDWGNAGVAVFFCISGFIIWTSSRKETVRQFVARRLIRIVPLYWLALAVVTVLAVKSWGKPFMSLGAIGKSAAFIPYYVGAPTGMPYPILVPGWTLNFEMFFYAVFAIGIAVRWPLALPVIVMSTLFVVGRITTPDAAPLALYTGWLSILFVAGILIGARERQAKMLALLWPIGACLVVAHRVSPWADPTLGTGAALLVAGLIARERRAGWPVITPMKILGDASYAIYLFHMPVAFLIGAAGRMIGQRPGVMPWPIYSAVCLAGAWVVGIAVHILIEKPLGRTLRRRAVRIAG